MGLPSLRQLRVLLCCALGVALAGCGSSGGGEGGEGGAGSTGTSPFATTTTPTTTTSSASNTTIQGGGTTSGPLCGEDGFPCCSGACNHPGLACIDFYCEPPRPFGADCTDDDDCSSNLCLDSGHCSKPCADAADCPPAPEWSCAELAGYTSDMCQCTPSGAETCDGHDDDCDGVVDDGASCSEPGFTCQSGACACDPANICDGVCKDLASDHENCGACGAACDAEAECFEGNCLTTLATGQNIPADLAIGADSLYWVNNPDGTIMKVPLAGGVPVTLASGQLHPQGVATDATHVYWTAGGDLMDGPGSVMKLPLAGGTPITLASPPLPWGIGLDATHVYWLGSFADGAVLRRVPIGGGAPSIIVPSDSWTVQGLAVDESGVYFAEYAGLKKVDHAGGAVTELVAVDITQRDDVALDATSVYFTTPYEVMKVAKAGGPATTLASQVYARGIAVDATHVYFVDDYGFDPTTGTVSKVPLDGGAIETLASGQYAPLSILVDATSVYWTTFDGNIMKAPK